MDASDTRHELRNLTATRYLVPGMPYLVPVSATYVPRVLDDQVRRARYALMASAVWAKVRVVQRVRTPIVQYQVLVYTWYRFWDGQQQNAGSCLE